MYHEYESVYEYGSNAFELIFCSLFIVQLLNGLENYDFATVACFQTTQSMTIGDHALN